MGIDVSRAFDHTCGVACLRSPWSFTDLTNQVFRAVDPRRRMPLRFEGLPLKIVDDLWANKANFEQARLQVEASSLGAVPGRRRRCAKEVFKAVNPSRSMPLRFEDLPLEIVKDLWATKASFDEARCQVATAALGVVPRRKRRRAADKTPW